MAPFGLDLRSWNIPGNNVSRVLASVNVASAEVELLLEVLNFLQRILHEFLFRFLAIAELLQNDHRT